MEKKVGICNDPDCELALKRVHQEKGLDEEFICSECKNPLEPLEGKPDKKPVDPNKKRLIILIIAVVVILAALGVGGNFLIKGLKAKKAEARAAFVADSLRKAEEQRIADSLRIIAEQQDAEKARLQAEEEAEKLRLAKEQRVADSLAAVKKQKPVNTVPSGGQSAGSGSSNWNGVASYNGPMQGGQPNGIGGKLTFKSNYQLDLKDGKGTKLEIKAGETIENTKFENGKLRQGELHRNDGTRKWFNI